MDISAWTNALSVNWAQAKSAKRQLRARRVKQIWTLILVSCV